MKSIGLVGVKRILLLILLILSILLLSTYGVYRSNYLYVKKGWSYSVIESGFTELSGLTHDVDGNLLITEEASNSEGQVIKLYKDGSRKVLYVGLDEPDVVRSYAGGLMVSEEQGIKGLGIIKNGVKQQLFPADSLEGFDLSADGKVVYAVEDNKSGRLLKYDIPSQILTVMVSGLNEAEGVCVSKDFVYFTEKKGNTFNRVGLSGGDVEVISRDVKKPSAVHCDNQSGLVWFAEERRNLGRLLRFDGKKMETVAHFLGEPQEIDSRDGMIYISDQRRGTIFKIFSTDVES